MMDGDTGENKPKFLFEASAELYLMVEPDVDDPELASEEAHLRSQGPTYFQAIDADLQDVEEAERHRGGAEAVP